MRAGGVAARRRRAQRPGAEGAKSGDTASFDLSLVETARVGDGFVLYTDLVPAG